MTTTGGNVFLADWLRAFIEGTEDVLTVRDTVVLDRILETLVEDA